MATSIVSSSSSRFLRPSAAAVAAAAATKNSTTSGVIPIRRGLLPFLTAAFSISTSTLVAPACASAAGFVQHQHQQRHQQQSAASTAFVRSPAYLRRSHHLSTSTRIMSTSAAAATESSPAVIPGRPTWQQTMLRIRDPKASIEFYERLGFTLIDSFDFPQYDFSLYFMTTLPEGETYDLKPGTQAAHDYLWSMEGVALELTHNHGTEGKDGFSYHPGNQERDGFGHVAVNVKDVYETSAKLEAAGCKFKKKPDEGRMKGLAFVYDPDGYWVEIVKRGEGAAFKNEYNFSQTMLRIKDPQKSLEFYKKLGMKVKVERHFDDFSLYFLASLNSDDETDVKDLFQPVLELTHNHGTEKQDDFKHYNGNEDGRQGFGHIGFLVDDVYKACDAIRDMGYGFRKEPDGGSMKGLAFAYDPDGYSVEIIKRGGIDFGDAKKD